MVNNRLVILASLAFVASSPVSADGLHSSLSFRQCTDVGLSSNFTHEEEMRYDVLRKGKKIGSHTIQFAPKPHGLQVTAHTKMKVKLLFVTVFKYEYVSEELWCGDTLLSAQTRVNDNGDKLQTSLLRTEQGYSVNSSRGSEDIEVDFQSTNHWNINVTKANQVFNTITGELNNVSYLPAEDTTIETELGSKPVTRYEVTGDLTINSFYDGAGNWSGMAFNHADGSPIEFRCIQCGWPPEALAAVSTAR